MRLTTDFHLVPRLRMSGAIYPLPPYAFTARTRKTVIFFYAFKLFRKALIKSNVKHEIHTNDIQFQHSAEDVRASVKVSVCRFTLCVFICIITMYVLVN